MSDTVTVPASLDEIPLTQEQAGSILAFAREGNLYEGQPASPEKGLEDAKTLVWHALTAHSRGNNMPQVVALINMAGQGVDPAAPLAAPSPTAVQQPAPAPTPSQNGNGSSGDYSTYTDEQIAHTLQALAPQSSLPAIQAEIDKLLAVQSERQQSVPAQPAAQAVSATAPPIPLPPQPSALPVQPTQAANGTAPDGAVGGPALGATPVPSAPDGQAADAAPAPAAEAPQPTGEGIAAPAQKDAEAERRIALEAQVNGGMLAAYGKTFADVNGLTVEQLEYMLAYPSGPPAQAVPETPQIPSPIASLDPQRESLVEQISGKTLKAHGKGRVDLATMPLEQLQWMVSHPEGPRWPGPADGPAPSQQAVVPTEVPVAPVPQQEPSVPVAPAAFVPHTPPVPTGELDGDLMFPDVQDVPRVPPDLSKLDDVDLRALHGRFHAVLARANWIIAGHKDALHQKERDLVLLRAQVRNELPKTVDGKRVTKDDAVALIEADPRIAELVATIDEGKRPLIKLEAISENARSTVARCSREWSFRKGEEFERKGM